MVRRLLIILTLCFAVILLVVSCDAASLREEERLVSVSFGEQSSRALKVALAEFDTDDYYWYYAAEKMDGSNLVSGQTASYDTIGAVAVSRSGEKGLDVVSGFSQGLWNFRLYAYKEKPTTAEDRAHYVYSGESTGVLLQSGSVNRVKVVVSPVMDSQVNGTLSVSVKEILQSSSIELGNVTGFQLGYAEVDDPVVPFAVDPATEHYSVALESGAYLIRVVLELDGGESISGSVVATVYSGLTTSINGSLVWTVVND